MADLSKRFNLVIEILFFSRKEKEYMPDAVSKFQSRNRDSFLFKPNKEIARLRKDYAFQSRNRDSFLFKYRSSKNATDSVCVSIS